MKENWCKKQKSDFLDNVGAFQKAPSQPLSSPKLSESVIQSNNDSFCPIDNLGATCWFNATMQSLCVTNMAKYILYLFEIAPINLNKDKNDNMKESVRDIIRYISDNALTGEKVPRQIVQVALRNLCLVVGNLGRHHGEQQDANEFYMQALSPLAHDLGEKLEVSQMFTCIDCGRQSTKNVSHLQNLCLTIPKKPGIKMSVSQLLKDYFEHDIIEKCSCGGCLIFNKSCWMCLTHWW